MKLEVVAQGRVIPNSGLRSFTEAGVAAHTNTRARRQFRHGSPGRGRSRLVALGEREGGVWPQIGDATIPPGGGNLCNFRPFVAKACTTLVVAFAPLGLHSHSVSVSCHKVVMSDRRSVGTAHRHPRGWKQRQKHYSSSANSFRSSKSALKRESSDALLPVLKRAIAAKQRRGQHQRGSQIRTGHFIM